MRINFKEIPNHFYLGAQVDQESHDIQVDSPVYYHAGDLVTHGVILGMTGSGKSGLAVALLEEAAMEGIPQLIIDPKGDMSNMLLAFPELSGEHFKPWINPQDAAQAEMEVDQLAQETADNWRDNLREWGIDEKRIQEYRQSSRFSIYTPGSDAGLPLSIVASFEAPPEGWSGNEEMLRERISGIVTAVLALIGRRSDPIEDPEHILLANIFEYHWRNDADLSMEQLILHVQDPPFSRLGVLELEMVLPEKERMKLAKELNQIIASPSFQSWMAGEPVDIPSLLYTKDGYPRTTIFYLAHLDDNERQFITTLLLESILAWMHTLSGASGLRALLYIDEVYGLFPPHPHNPPTKEPLMRLIKQGRAHGIGLLMATQNAKDIDYKGLTNAGTWFIGRLPTEHDRERALEGLDTASGQTTRLSKKKIKKLIGQLEPREFILHDIHASETPILMKTRWAMSYLAGPLTRTQISSLMENQRDYFKSSKRSRRARRRMNPGPSKEVQERMAMRSTESSERGGAASPTYVSKRISGMSTASARPLRRDEAPPGFAVARPSFSSKVEEYFLPVDYTADVALRNWAQQTRQTIEANATDFRLLYQPALLAQLTVRFTHRKTNSDEMLWYAFIIPNLADIRMAQVEWGPYQAEPFDPHSLELSPFSEAYYATLPPIFTAGSGFKDLKDSLTRWVYNHFELYVYHNPVLNMYNGLNESRSTFMERLQTEARQRRHNELEELAQTYERRFDRLEDKAKRKLSRIEAEEEELKSRKQEELVSAGESALRLLQGGLYRTISRIAQLRRYSSQSDEQVEVLEEDLAIILEDIDEAEEEMDNESQAIRRKWADAVKQIEEIPVTPNKKDITLVLFGVGWTPHWSMAFDDTHIILPASSSGLAQDQMAVYDNRVISMK